MASVRISTLRSTSGGADVVSLIGATTIVAGSTEIYEISDYDDFSVYSASVDQGTVTLNSNETLSVTVPEGATGIVVLTVRRNNTPRVFQIAIGENAVTTPAITSPLQGSVNVSTSITLQATPFSTVPVGAGTQTNSQWQVARDSGFGDIVASTTKTTGNLAQFSVNDLPRNTTLYARVRYNSSIGMSAWSNAVSFTTTNQQIGQPTVTIVGQNFGVMETPTFDSSPFSATPAGSDTHVATSWVLRNVDDNSIVWQEINSSVNKLSITVPKGILNVDTHYTMEIQHIGGFGVSPFSEKYNFVTAETFIPDEIGTPFGGGYYAGRINVDGQIYAIVVAPKALGGESPVRRSWGPSNAPTGTISTNDGWANCAALETAGIANYPAARFCRDLSIGGYNDWYLPAKDELEILYRNFKPTTLANDTSSGANPSSVPPTSNYTSGNPAQTSVALFQQGGAEAFTSSNANGYWSSSSFGSSRTSAHSQFFYDGRLAWGGLTGGKEVRAIRRVLVS